MTEVFVEVRPDPHRAGDLSGDKLAERFAARVEEMGTALGDIANGLRDQLERRLSADSDSDSAWRLDQLQLSFKFDLQAEAGVILARAGATAGFEASLTWKRPTAPIPPSVS